MKISDLKSLRVVNLENGKVLGRIHDLVLDVNEGTVKAMILPGEGKWRLFSSTEKELEVPWEKIRKLGKDVILVEVAQSWPLKE
ncbi:MAG: YlmC/YmxH family sporulation protein [Firmicutes bacterium]|nr:YlmC/YmxH family sporulation protein [Bacillota bacterium]